jgi:serine/threonine protein kinase
VVGPVNGIVIQNNPSGEEGRAIISRSFMLREFGISSKNLEGFGPANMFSSCNDKHFVVKIVSSCQFQKASIIKNALPRNTFVRLSIDEIEDQNALVYDYVMEDLQKLARRVKFNRSQIKRICHHVLQAIAELHDTAWMHGGLFFKNIMTGFWACWILWLVTGVISQTLNPKTF